MLIMNNQRNLSAKMKINGDYVNAKIKDSSLLGFTIEVNIVNYEFNLNEVIVDFQIYTDSTLLYKGEVTVIHIQKLNSSLLMLEVLCITGSIDLSNNIDLHLNNNLNVFVREKESYLELNQLSEMVNGPTSLTNIDLVTDLGKFLKNSEKYFSDLDTKLNLMSPEEKFFQRHHLISEVKPIFTQCHDRLLHHLNECYASIETDARTEFIEYNRWELQQYYLQSPFTNRSVRKPLGYSGDFIQILSLLSMTDYSSLPLFALLMNDFILNIAPSKAHRNRIDYLFHFISSRIMKKRELNQPFHFTSIGCGPAIEVLRIAEQVDCSNVHVTLMDMEPLALRYCKDKLEEIIARTGSKIQYDIKQVNVKNLIKSKSISVSQDFIYCAGLFDYLTDKFCTKILQSIYGNLNTEGQLLFTNVSKQNNYKYLMEIHGEWIVNERDDADMRSLCSFIKDDLIEITFDSTKVNLFAHIKKS